jgi:hypothetical protein
MCVINLVETQTRQVLSAFRRRNRLQAQGRAKIGTGRLFCLRLGGNAANSDSFAVG